VGVSNPRSGRKSRAVYASLSSPTVYPIFALWRCSRVYIECRRGPCGGLERGVFWYAAEKNELSKLRHEAENR
jgi:hypothetical protein